MYCAKFISNSNATFRNNVLRKKKKIVALMSRSHKVLAQHILQRLMKISVFNSDNAKFLLMDNFCTQWKLFYSIELIVPIFKK